MNWNQHHAENIGYNKGFADGVKFATYNLTKKHMSHTPTRCQDCKLDITKEVQYYDKGKTRCERCNLALDKKEKLR